MLTLSDSAKHTASLTRLAVTDPLTWHHVTTALYPTAMKGRSTDSLMVYYKVEGQEDAIALWHHEYQMGYIVVL